MITTKKTNFFLFSPAVGLLLCYLADYLFNISFYFDAFYPTYQLWFPNGFFAAFLFFKLLLPVLIATWAISFFGRTTVVVIGKIATTTVCLFIIALVSYLISYLQFKKTIQIVWLVAFAELLKIAYPLVINIAKKFSQQKLLSHLWACSFFFLYIFFCIVLPDSFLPFYKFTMYNSMSKNDYLFLLRDKNNQLVPIQQYFKLNSKGLNQLYLYTTNLNGSNLNTDNKQYEQLWENILKYNNNNPLPVDSLFLIQSNLMIINGVITTKEKLIHAAKVE